MTETGFASKETSVVFSMDSDDRRMCDEDCVCCFAYGEICDAWDGFLVVFV